METASLIFITGGVRSGKSSFAEQTAVDIAMETGGPLYYLATGVPFDGEMNERIKKHQYDRERGKNPWKTIEQSVNIGEIAGHFQGDEVILLDCLTTLLNNELYAANHTWDENFLRTVFEKIITGVLNIKKRARTLIIVSNEVLHEPIQDNELISTYKRLLGQLHQLLVKEADIAYLVDSGIPVRMKGGTNG
jgi:adenosylcobinamide kinase/adenosylcobinamide-phosphate guanylyltransferase